MRVSWLAAVLVSSCSCDEKKVEPAPSAPAVARPALVTPTPPSPLRARWVQQQLTPQRTTLLAQIDYGPTTEPVTVQLELPPNAQVTGGRTFFQLAPVGQATTHSEPIVILSQALPVADLVLKVTSGGVELAEPYRFGRR